MFASASRKLSKNPLRGKKMQESFVLSIKDFSYNSKIPIVALPRITHSFPANFAEKHTFLIFTIALYIMKILKVYFSEKFSGKVWVILGKVTVSIFELDEKLYTR